jgi:hypothetical protein
VKLAGTAGINVEAMSASKAVVSLQNRRRVQNHIGGIHACGMALVSESATGIVVGMNVPDTHLPLCKSMKVNFVKRCEGASPCHDTHIIMLSTIADHTPQPANDHRPPLPNVQATSKP